VFGGGGGNQSDARERWGKSQAAGGLIWIAGICGWRKKKIAGSAAPRKARRCYKREKRLRNAGSKPMVEGRWECFFA